ncbi:MAG: IclR family transcriptional regulator [Burkholderiaceae bacterium]
MAADGDRTQRGIQSIEVGGTLLIALIHHGGPMPLKDLAREAGMPAAKAHPYLVSFGRLGLIEQDAATGRYFLGPLSLQMGLISLQQADPVHVATPRIVELAQRIRHTVALGVWGSRGATIVRLEESPAAIYVNMRHGTVFSVTNTASGRLFGAYLPAPVVKALLDEEHQRERATRGRGAKASGMPERPKLPSWAEFETQLTEVRAHGMSRSEGEVVRGISAMAAPVFDHAGAMVLSITAIGPSGTFDTRWNGELARAIKQCAADVSQRLGARKGAAA